MIAATITAGSPVKVSCAPTDIVAYHHDLRLAREGDAFYDWGRLGQAAPRVVWHPATRTFTARKGARGLHVGWWCSK